MLEPRLTILVPSRLIAVTQLQFHVQKLGAEVLYMVILAHSTGFFLLDGISQI